MAFKQKGFPMMNTSALKHGKLKDFQSGKKGHNPDKMSAKHEDWHLKQSGEGKPFKMKDSPMKRNFGIGADSPMKETTTQTLQGMSFNPYAHQTLRADDIPSFRDMVSLEQQQAARKAWKEKRAGKKEDEYNKRMEEERPERERQLKADEGELYSELAGIEERERKKEEERLANEPIDYGALEIPEEEFPEGPSEQYLANNPS